MKTRMLSGMLMALALATVALAGPRDAQWKQVDEATKKGLPKTAIEQLEPIIASALADKAYPEAIKAIARKIALEITIQGGKSEEAIARLQAELDKAPTAMKPVMEAILAHWYWNYFQQHRWEIQQRTTVAGPGGPDLRTWDLTRLLAEIDRHFSAALAEARTLQTTPVSVYDDLLPSGTAPDAYRPTLWDFLVYDALEFYQAGEHAGTEAEDEFEITVDSPMFADAAEFMNWQPATSDRPSSKLKAIRLYQALLRFHASDADLSAFYDADLARLSYGNNTVSEESGTSERLKSAMRRFIAITAKHEITARGSALLARLLFAMEEPGAARDVAQAGFQAYPQSVGGAECLDLIRQIEAKSANLQTEFVWSAPWPTLRITYRNVSHVYFRAVSADFIKQLPQFRRNLQSNEARQELLASKPVLEWDSDLPLTKDFKARTVELPAPGSLKPGFYYILASHERDFGQADNQISATHIWVSDLAVVVLSSASGGNTKRGLVVRARSGEPVAGATVRVWQHANIVGEVNLIATTTTDQDGRFQLEARNGEWTILAEEGGQSVSNGEYLNSYDAGSANKPDSKTVFFTDRAIYRPGQSIHYKGVAIRFNQVASKYSVLARQSLTVVFSDRNGKEISRATHSTNEYGSFAGVFTAPRDRLMGQMALEILGRPSRAYIRVEEYKRPKFQVELVAPAEAAVLNAPVMLKGRATAYTGAAIGGARVKWRVERVTRYPYWIWWAQTPSAKALAHGTAVTDTGGSFQVQFRAEPDLTVSPKHEPTFAFIIHADITDTTGETRSDARVVRAGYTAMQASLGAKAWQTPEIPVEFAIRTSSLDGDPQAARGTLTISALQQPAFVVRGALDGVRFQGNFRLDGNFESGEPLSSDPANPESWEPGDIVARKPVQIPATGEVDVKILLPKGIYRAVLETKDRLGVTVIARCTVQVVDLQSRHFGVKLPNYFFAEKLKVEPGETFTALWGTGYDQGRAFVELAVKGRKLQSYWTAAESTQEIIHQKVTEDLRGGFTLRIIFVRENRAYINQQVVEVPWTNKQLAVKWEHFRSKLMPGQPETWTAVVKGPDTKPAKAELVAALYDASLDAFAPHAWPEMFDVFRQEYAWEGESAAFLNSIRGFETFVGWDSPAQNAGRWTYRTFPRESTGGVFWEEEVQALSKFNVSSDRDAGYLRTNAATATRIGMEVQRTPMAIEIKSSEFLADTNTGPMDVLRYSSSGSGDTAFLMPRLGSPDLSKVMARKNLSETAFFFPQLLAGDDGVVKLQFTVPEALTEWKFLGFAHDKQLRSGLLTGKAVTAKDLMVEPNPPRFVREGDAIEFTVKVSNRTDQPQVGTVRLTFADATTLKPVDEALGNRVTEQPFELPAKQSRSFSWRVSVPDGMGFLTYKAVGASAQASDGEEGFLPVLSRRVLVTESLPLPIRGKTTKEFVFKKLVDSGQSDTLRSQSLTVQMTSQPAWYAVLALPYLMEFPHECSEQIFNRFYANALARHISKSDPKIRRIFDLWKGTPTLDSPLQKNQDLKSVMIDETPWLREAAAETESRRNVGLLFDANRLDEESARALHQLTERQGEAGLWSWFPGGQPSDYISLYITTGFGRLRHLGVEMEMEPAVKSLARLDTWIAEHHREILKRSQPEDYIPSSTDALYLYGRSFFLKDRTIAKESQVAVDFLLQQSRKFWVKVGNRQSQAHLALALQRFGDGETPAAILKSIKEHSVSDEEMGMYWRDTESSGWWYDAPIETQAMMIEAFDEIGHDGEAVEACKVWLLKQKQTQDWKTTKATADAIYGLLLHGKNLLASDALVEVSLGGKKIKPEHVEAGSGFYEQKFVRQEIKPAMGQITVKKTDDGVSWGSVHWQYLEDIAKISPHAGTPLQLKKTLFTKETTKSGQVLKPVNGPLAVGDELVVRIELRADRDMEFIHLKDQRGSGTEPVNVLSGYKYQDGLGYYETTRDTASHFFIDYLPKGVHVFEYSTRVQLKGSYQSGMAEIQCMYAPEFNSHSESFVLDVK